MAVKDAQSDNDAIDETATVIAAAIRKHVERERQRADAELKAIAAQNRDAQSEKKELERALDASRAEVEELQRQLQDALNEQALAESHYQQLVAASQQLTEGLSRTLSQQREQGVKPASTPPPKRSEAPAPKSAPSAKKPLQFSGPARDTKRVRIRQGTHLSVDGISGQLVDLSLGGVQAVLTQMVKPNQLVRVTIPTAGERITCKGRTVWVVYEQPGTSMSVYRTGVKFTDSDSSAIENFMRDFAAEPRKEVATTV